ncbi:shikimate dehydrogenase [Protaetiibacter sp. SSC-01]|uniref:shikimate dehydrogenase n=1 Tax=Protaetiibacter sp. SSC-01 TaxID=2759943 RepID=UPI001656AD46|nr:shikimate dehydrogenase [Protaetiibacter sp. SSC-01]QNO36396.1 shikimate dehydrogenase [Protaetiibacter sp. SSC-01]
MADRTRLAVLGSPIGHSRSPQLHRAAYAVLGLDWEYDRVEVDDAGLEGFLAGLAPEWRGLSLTMPLKRRVAELVPEVDDVARRTRQGNTILLDHGRPVKAFNTDVHGIVAALADAGVASARRATVLGGGATAESAVLALESLGAEVTVAVRDVAKVVGSGTFASSRVVALGPETDAALAESDAAVSTIPPGAEFTVALPALRGSQTLLDVAYAPWPTPLAAAWTDAGGTVVHGLEMLLHQAVHQIRIFVAGDASVPLADEAAVIRAMRAAVG